MYKGTPFDVGLWRIPADHYDRLRLKILPYPDNFAARLSAGLHSKLPDIDSGKNAVTVTVTEQFEAPIGMTR